MFGRANPLVEHQEAISRQHRVLSGVLRLLSRVLASLHKGSRSGAPQALIFLNSHRDSILMILHETQQNPSNVGLEESQMIVSLLGMVLHTVSDEDRKNSAAFGAYHLAVLSLAARFFDPYWAEGVEDEDRPQMEKKIVTFNQVVLAYLCTATRGLKAGGGYPVFLDGSQIAKGGAQSIC